MMDNKKIMKAGGQRKKDFLLSNFSRPTGSSRVFNDSKDRYKEIYEK